MKIEMNGGETVMWGNIWQFAILDSEALFVNADVYYKHSTVIHIIELILTPCSYRLWFLPAVNIPWCIHLYNVYIYRLIKIIWKK